MKLLKLFVLAGTALLFSGCASTDNAAENTVKTPEIGVISGNEQLAATAAGKLIGNKVLEALSKNDYTLLNGLAIGNEGSQFTVERFNNLMKKVQGQGGISQYSYLGDLSMYPYHRMLWKVTFKNLEKSEVKAAMDVLFELHIAKVGDSYRAVGFGFRQ